MSDGAWKLFEALARDVGRLELMMLVAGIGVVIMAVAGVATAIQASKLERRLDKLEAREEAREAIHGR